MFAAEWDQAQSSRCLEPLHVVVSTTGWLQKAIKWLLYALVGVVPTPLCASRCRAGCTVSFFFLNCGLLYWPWQSSVRRIGLHRGIRCKRFSSFNVIVCEGLIRWDLKKKTKSQSCVRVSTMTVTAIQYKSSGIVRSHLKTRSEESRNRDATSILDASCELTGPCRY